MIPEDLKIGIYLLWCMWEQLSHLWHTAGDQTWPDSHFTLPVLLRLLLKVQKLGAHENNNLLRDTIIISGSEVIFSGLLNMLIRFQLVLSNVAATNFMLLLSQTQLSDYEQLSTSDVACPNWCAASIKYTLSLKTIWFYSESMSPYWNDYVLDRLVCRES